MRHQIEHPAQGIIVGKAGLVFRDLTELAVESLDNVGRVYDSPDLRRIFTERAQNFPIFLPALHTGRVLSAPFFSKLEQVFLCAKSRLYAAVALCTLACGRVCNAVTAGIIFSSSPSVFWLYLPMTFGS